jgi:WD40 repeat protein
MKYKAFISYRRHDAALPAKWLRRRLLAFRPPPDYLRRLIDEQRAAAEAPGAYFLDTSYQSANEDFWHANIEPALRDSEYLIVLSSPSALAMRSDGSANWVAREIDCFLEGRGEEDGRRRILVGLCPGAPDDAFPGQLSTLSRQWDWADLRGLSRWRFLRPGAAERLDDAFLKIVARLFDVPQELLPILRREEARRRGRVRMAVAGAVASVILGLSAALGWAVVERQNAQRERDNAQHERDAAQHERDVATEQRGIAEKQRALADEQRGIAEDQRKRAEQNLETAQRNESNFLANVSRRLGAAGDLRGALSSALEAVPRTPNERPLVQAAVEALLQAVLTTANTPMSSDAIPLSALPFGTSVNGVPSPDGRLFALAGTDTIAVWDLVAGEQRYRFPTSGACGRTRIAFSPDSSVLAVGCPIDGQLRAWLLKTREPLLAVDGYKNIGPLDLDSSGERLAVTRDRGAAEVIELKSGKVIARITPPGNGYPRIKLSPDGRRAFVWTGTWAAVWDVDQNRIGWQFDQPGFALSASFSPDSKAIAIGTSKSSAQLRDSGTGSLLREFRHDGAVGYVAFDRAGNRLLTSDWLPLSESVAPDDTLRRIYDNPNKIPAMWSADDRVLVHVTDHVRVLGLTNEQPALDLPLNAETINVHDGRSGRMLTQLNVDLGSQAFVNAEGTAVYTYIRAVRRWSLANFQLISRLHTPEGPAGISFSTDGSSMTLFAGMGGPMPITAYGPIAADAASDVADSKSLGTLLAVTPTFALLNAGSETRLLDLRNGQLRARWTTDTPLRAAVSPDGACAYSLSFANQPALLVADRNEVIPFPDAPGAPADVHFVGKGCRLLATYDDGAARLWDLVDGKLTIAKELFRDRPPTLALAGFGVVVAAFPTGEVRLLDADGSPKGKPLRMPKGATVRSALLAAGGDRLLVLYGDATLAFWDTRTGALLGQTKYFADQLAVHSPPGLRKAVIYGSGRSPELWDLETAKRIAALEDRQAETNAVGFTPDGRRIATASVDHSVRIWDGTDGHLVAKIDAGGGVRQVAWTPDGSKLTLTMPQERALVTFELPEGTALLQLGERLLSSFPPDRAGIHQ